MIDVRVGENDRVKILDWKRESAVLIRGFLTLSLKHPAVERNSMPVDVEQVTGAGDLTRSTDEGYLQTANLLLRHHAETG
jgi:hypothetical protein